MDHTEDLEEQVRRLETSVDTLQARLAQLEGKRVRKVSGSNSSNRRDFLRLGGAAALGAVGTAALRAAPVSAADGGAFTLGQANLAAIPTTIQGDIEAGPVGPPTPVLSAKDSTFTAIPGGNGALAGAFQGLGPGTIAVPVSGEGVDGWAGGATGYGVYGLTDAGTGVVGEANTGIGLYARRSGRIRQEGLGGPGIPGYAPNLFEQVRDSDGVLWIHNAAGGWRRVNTPRADAADGLGGAFKPLRIVDTRLTTGPAGATGGSAGNGTTRSYQVAGDVGSNPASQIPTDAIAVFGNLTVVAGIQGGFLAVHPTGVAFDPAADPSSLNFPAKGVVANAFFCGLGTGANLGKIAVYVGVFGTSRVNFIIDITGYVQ
jgi:hypothetical protein